MYINFRSIAIYLVVMLVVYSYDGHLVRTGTDAIGLSFPGGTTCLQSRRVELSAHSLETKSV
jgi:hypothetical protein